MALAKRFESALLASAPAASRKLLEIGPSGRGLSLRPKSLLLGTIALILLGVSCNRQAAPGPDVWAVVNNKNILREDVEKVYHTRVNADAPAPSQEEALSLKLNILDELINSEILLDRANKMNLVASDAEVEEKFT